MLFKKEENKLSADFKNGTLCFEIFSPEIEVKGKLFLAASPTNHFELYPSGEEDVIIFRVNEDHEVIGFEDDVETVNRVMEKVMAIC